MSKGGQGSRDLDELVLFVSASNAGGLFAPGCHGKGTWKVGRDGGLVPAAIQGQAASARASRASRATTPDGRCVHG